MKDTMRFFYREYVHFLCFSNESLKVNAMNLRFPGVGEEQNKNQLSIIVLSLTALFNNTRTLKLKAQPTNGFFVAVNQEFGGSSQLTTTTELCSLSELCKTI